MILSFLQEDDDKEQNDEDKEEGEDDMDENENEESSIVHAGPLSKPVHGRRAGFSCKENDEIRTKCVDMIKGKEHVNLTNLRAKTLQTSSKFSEKQILDKIRYLKKQRTQRIKKT